MWAKLKLFWRRRPAALTLGVAALLVGGSVAAARLARPSGTTAPASADIPIGEVKRGDLVDSVELRGEVKAEKSAMLSAPFNVGDLQIVKLARPGTMVHKGDVVVQFDTTNLENTLAQRRSEWKQALAQVENLRATAKLTHEQDQTNLLKAKYDVERARLEASKQEILSAIDGAENKLKLADAEQALRETQEKLTSDDAGAAADIAGAQQKADKALYEVRQRERAIARMTLRAPVDGMVNLLPNWRASGFFSSSAPEFKEGDRAWSGAGIAELPDLRTLRVTCRVDESERGRLRAGQTATLRVDAVPDKAFTGRIAEIGPLAKPDFSGWPPTKNFDVALALEQSDARLRPGMSATVRVAVDRVANVVVVPAEAVFARNAYSVAYVLTARALGKRFEERAIQVGRRGDGQLEILQGLAPGEKVALKDPTREATP